MMHIDQFSQKNILIIGDVMLDSYLSGSVNRISPEAPVPVLALENTESRLGGAANVALNIKALGGNCEIISVIGDDKNGNTLIDLLKQEKIEVSRIIRSKNRPTTEKTRLLAKHQQILRVDSEVTHDINQAEEKELMVHIQEALKQQSFQAIILQDYNKGVLTESLIPQIIELAQQYEVSVFVDPKFKNFLVYKSVFCFKPNLKELSDAFPEFSGKTDSIEGIAKMADYCRVQLQAEHIFLTLSEKGAMLVDANGYQHIPAFTLNKIIDVSGAGDSVISAFTLACASGHQLIDSAKISTLAGGLACQQPGVVPVTQESLKLAVDQYQISM